MDTIYWKVKDHTLWYIPPQNGCWNVEGKIDEIGQWQNRAPCLQKVIYRKLSTARPILPFLDHSLSLTYLCFFSVAFICVPWTKAQLIIIVFKLLDIANTLKFAHIIILAKLESWILKRSVFTIHNSTIHLRKSYLQGVECEQMDVLKVG